jgi:hypothetical protein
MAKLLYVVSNGNPTNNTRATQGADAGLRGAGALAWSERRCSLVKATSVLSTMRRDVRVLCAKYKGCGVCL